MSRRSRQYRQKQIEKQDSLATASNVASDSYSNVPARLGQGVGNQASAGTYPLVRRSHDFMLVLSLYRSNWIFRKVVDVLAEDMLKDFPRLASEIAPDEIKAFERAAKKTYTLGKLISAAKWGRAFGGAVAIPIISGQNDLSKPLDLDSIEVGSYRGLIVLDRWSGVQPSANLVEDIESVDFGLPESYTCTTNTKGKAVFEVHHSRVLRFTGRELPEWERQAELYWGMSEIELIYDELQKRDYTSWNIVSLLTRAQIMAMKDPELAQKQSGALMSNDLFNQYLQRMSQISEGLNNQGLLVLGKDGGIESHQYSFGGLADVYNTFMLDVSGAAEIPVSRLYGRTITGLGQSGEGDLQVYYDTVEQKRARELGPQIDKLLPIICMSTFGKVPDDLDYTWPPVRTLSDKDRSDLADKLGTSIKNLYEGDLLTKKEARKDLKQVSELTGLGSNITDDALEATPDTYASEAGGGELDLPEFGEKQNEPEQEEKAGEESAQDTIAKVGSGYEVKSEHGGKKR